LSDIVWFLDVDGVLNDLRHPLSLIDTPEAPFQTIQAKPEGSPHSYQIQFSPSILKRIVDLHTSGKVEVRWLTTWQSSANSALREVFGFPEDLVVACDDRVIDNGHSDWWKAHVVREHIAAGLRKIIWTDDDLSASWYSNAVGKVLGIMEDEEVDYCGVSPVASLTHEHLDKIEEWIDENSAS